MESPSSAFNQVSDSAAIETGKVSIISLISVYLCAKFLQVICNTITLNSPWPLAKSVFSTKEVRDI